MYSLHCMHRPHMFFACLVLVGCAADAIVLPAYTRDAPEAVDLSGMWRLHDAGEPTSGPPEALVRVFLEFGEVLKITQTDHGLFVSFDRAIVEEYRFGEQRRISVGPIEAQRSSGWEGRSYVVETLDNENVRLTERLQLDAKNDVLLRIIEIRRGERSLFRQQQVFARQ